jgi:hypothetical protein
LSGKNIKWGYKKMKQFNEIICEISSQECEEKFGEYLFGEFKEFYIKAGLEKDTPTEKKIFDNIIKFIRGDYVGKKEDQTLIKSLKELAECKSRYNIILKPEQNILYRGSVISETDLNKIKKLSPTSEIGQQFNKIGKFTYKGRSKVQSWTTNMNVAKMFAEDSYYDYSIPSSSPAVMRYNFKGGKDILFNTTFLNKLSKKAGYSVEDEIIRIENKPIKVDIFIANPEEL